jgi:catechol 2,3-dioxygenase-like lactoylglutathione lyase family enzyme
MPVTRLLRVSVTVADVDAMAAFYRDALGLPVSDVEPLGDLAWNALLGLAEGTTARGVSVTVGAQEIKLVVFDPPGAPYPTPRHANDQWFEHVALVAGGIHAVWKRIEAAKPGVITYGEPVLLPPNTGGVTAFKFRDPEGHPLELLSFPDGVGDPRWQLGEAGIRGYDHTAIAVTDVARSTAFYTDLLGFRVAGRSLNTGAEQDRLDGLPSCEVDVVALQPASVPTPHLELLHYRAPQGRAAPAPVEANGVAAARQVHEVSDLEGLVKTLSAADVAFVSPGIVTLKTGRNAAVIRDPDGHMIVLMA